MEDILSSYTNRDEFIPERKGTNKMVEIVSQLNNTGMFRKGDWVESCFWHLASLFRLTIGENFATQAAVRGFSLCLRRMWDFRALQQDENAAQGEGLAGSDLTVGNISPTGKNTAVEKSSKGLTPLHHNVSSTLALRRILSPTATFYDSFSVAINILAPLLFATSIRVGQPAHTGGRGGFWCVTTKCEMRPSPPRNTGRSPAKPKEGRRASGQ